MQSKKKFTNESFRATDPDVSKVSSANATIESAVVIKVIIQI